MQDFRFLTVREAATVLGVTPETVRAWCSRFGFGIRPTPTAHWRIPESRLTQFHGLADNGQQAARSGVCER
jgi:hypothetical protein